MDFHVQRCTRRCVKTGEEFQPDEMFYSLLVAEGSEVVRHDFSRQAWEGPPEGILGWWKSRMPSRKSHKVGWAPNDIMLEFFLELAEQPHKSDLRYILTLLLIRRRIMRLEDTEVDEEGVELLVVYCPRREESYRVPVATPDDRRTQEIQNEIAQLLFAEVA